MVTLTSDVHRRLMLVLREAASGVEKADFKSDLANISVIPSQSFHPRFLHSCCSLKQNLACRILPPLYSRPQRCLK